MDDSDFVCPLCCEELDISDREFYPCKCGYQVCMWCWHRIRESESGLCPACRTPYGEDPHQFSAVDVEDVLKANKEKEVAAKKERDKLRQNNFDGDDDHALPIPSDRTQLANMRVIRRNLVYAVGLPIQIATEEILKKPEYFGQYGKIYKIVINRAQTQGTDPKRATASAYITFVHKEDTLACILALDGFYMENKNVRASYGTSKYCSAFIKNVRCNNPECTYLHEMGAGEDTFTKQEIQAGYVTSGRDVLARQQQIVAEQLRLGAVTGTPRKRIGCGGPSGTGRASNSPIFPPPEFDEPVKLAAMNIPPPFGNVPRSMTTGGISTLTASTVPAKLGRAASITSSLTTAEKSPTLGSAAPSSLLTGAQKNVQSVAPLATTVASVVAGAGRPNKSDVSDTHITLTPLTPLKRNSKSTRIAAGAPAQPSGAEMKSGSNRNGTSKKQYESMSYGESMDSETLGSEESIIGGDVIGPPSSKPRHAISNSSFDSLAGLSSPLDPVASLGGQDFCLGNHQRSASTLGGDVFTGRLPNSSAIGSKKDRWNSGSGRGAAASGDMWTNSSSFPSNDPGHALIGGSIIGGSTVPLHSPGNSSSALASMLGISLPTGSGSLASSGDMWVTTRGPSALSALNNSAAPINDTMASHQNTVSGSSSIGGVPIGGNFVGSVGTIGGGSNKNDIALLQSLLPGVHITAGDDSVFGRASSWSNNSSGQRLDPVGPSNSQQDPRRGQGIW